MVLRQGSQTNSGVPQFGHKTHLRVFIDPNLPQHDPLIEYASAAEGTWIVVFGIELHELIPGQQRGSCGPQTNLNVTSIGPIQS